jgi:uncharacterized SAM-binding protein YcdF (DUF218 family)
MRRRGRGGRVRRQLLFMAMGFFVVVLYASGHFAWQIWTYQDQSSDGPADVALVLGAAADGVAPSPVYAERLRHAVDLYQRSRVGRLMLTGGRGPGDPLAESEVGRDWVIAQGVPDYAVLIETESRTTLENLINARAVLDETGMGKVLLVSDPLHLQRAMWMALTLKYDVAPSPTPTSRYQTLGTQLPMLFREVWFSFVWFFGQR